jgi:hypothetical protein
VKRLLALLVVTGFLFAVGCGPATTSKAGGTKAPGGTGGAGGAGGAGGGAGEKKDK